MKFGRYEIKFGKYFWIQPPAPNTWRRFLCFWIFKEARPWDVDKKQQFLPGTPLEHEGRTYRYAKLERYQPGDEPVHEVIRRGG